MQCHALCHWHWQRHCTSALVMHAIVLSCQCVVLGTGCYVLCCSNFLLPVPKQRKFVCSPHSVVALPWMLELVSRSWHEMKIRYNNIQPVQHWHSTWCQCCHVGLCHGIGTGSNKRRKIPSWLQDAVAGLVAVLVLVTAMQWQGWLLCWYWWHQEPATGSTMWLVTFSCSDYSMGKKWIDNQTAVAMLSWSLWCRGSCALVSLCASKICPLPLKLSTKIMMSHPLKSLITHEQRRFSIPF